MNPIILYAAIFILSGWAIWSIIVIGRINDENDKLKRIIELNCDKVIYDSMMHDFNDSCDFEPSECNAELNRARYEHRT
jgi:hypothetical protein